MVPEGKFSVAAREAAADDEIGKKGGQLPIFAAKIGSCPSFSPPIVFFDNLKGMKNMTLNTRNKIGVLLCLALFAHPSQLLALDSEPRLDNVRSAAVGVGFEVSRGDYGTGADATLVTMQLSIFLYPAEKLDVTLEIPFLYLSSKSGSGVIVTHSGGAGRGRSASTSMTATTTTTTTTVQESGIGDINMTTGWTLLPDREGTPKVRPTFYLKAPSGDLNRGLGTGTVEVGPGLSVSKWLGNVQLFGEGAYIFQLSLIHI